MQQTRIAPKPQAKRNLNLDLIRCVAVISVIARHFFLNTGYDNRILEGNAMMLMTFFRTATMVCVPLFVLLTGYLCNKKELTLSYFGRIIPILVTYLLSCLVTLGYRSAMGEEISLLWGISQIIQIDNGAVWYAWYIEMYIGLYLLIPFINILYHGLQTKGKKQLLIAVCLFMTMLPVSSNIYNLSAEGFWRNPATSEIYHSLIPDWWTSMWPLTYYFIGAYIREYGVKLSKGKHALLILVSLVVFTAYNIYRSQGTSLFRPNLDNWGGFQNTVDSILVFSLLLQLDLTRVPRVAGWLLNRISILSLGIYLCSYMSDMMVYTWFAGCNVSVDQHLLWYPGVVLASFLIAAVLSQFVSWGQMGIMKVLDAITALISRKVKANG